jgi:hypothetical protein
MIANWHANELSTNFNKVLCYFPFFFTEQQSRKVRGKFAFF